MTDDTGRFVFRDVPAGVIDVAVSYSGFDDMTQKVALGEGESKEVQFVMETTDIIVMEPFVVAAVREGQALAITEQRAADNIKTVVALDEWGILPTQNVGELVARMVGISEVTDEDDLIFNVSIRGQPALFTRLNVDGMSTTGVSGIGRGATLHSFSASSFEQIEIIAGQTPDKRADSIGGQLNLKTRSPLAMREKRRINYSVSGRYFPSFADRNVPLENDPLHPDISVGYTEIFDVFGGTRNLGLSVNASFQVAANPIDYDFLQYQFTNDPVAYFHDYAKFSGLNPRYIEGYSIRGDYRWSDSTIVSLRFLYNAGGEPHYDRVRVNPFAPRTIFTPATPTGAILPGFTANRTEVRPVALTRFDVETWGFSFYSKNPTGTLTFEHDWGRLRVDHAYRWSHTTWWSGHGKNQQAGQYISRLNAPLGFILDNSNLDGRVFTQTAGPDIYNPASYTPIVLIAANTTTQPVPITSRTFVKRDTTTRTNEGAATANVTYSFDTKLPLVLKAGVDTIHRRVNNIPLSPRRWYGVVGSVLTTDLMPLSEFERQHGGARVPAYNPTAVSTTLNNPSLWYEDVNFNATQPYTARRLMEERVDAAYVQLQAKPLPKLTILGGVRHEWVSTDTFTFFRARSTPIATQPDHYLRAKMDFRAQTTSGEYSNSFPSIHFAYDITSSLKARASWSTSYGRPFMQQLVPAVVVSEVLQRVTIGNPALEPQMSDNIDLKLEYYFKKSGVFSVGVFQKDITQFISGNLDSGEQVPDGPDNGFDGLYGGFAIFRPTNIGNATVEGIEVDYRQHLDFLPGVLKGLIVSANYTYQRTEGFVPGAPGVGPLAGFVPRLFNARFQYNYRKFGASFDANFSGKHLIGFSLLPGASRFRSDLLRYNAGFTYLMRPEATLFLNIANITEAGPEQFFAIESRIAQRLIAPLAIKFGVTGRF